MIPHGTRILLDPPRSIGARSAPAQGDPAGLTAGTETADAASGSSSLVLFVLGAALLIPVAFLLYRRFLPRAAPETASPPDPKERISRLELKGEVISAAELSEESGLFRKAAVLYE